MPNTAVRHGKCSLHDAAMVLEIEKILKYQSVRFAECKINSGQVLLKARDNHCQKNFSFLLLWDYRMQ